MATTTSTPSTITLVPLAILTVHHPAGTLTVRPFSPADAPSLTHHANNRAISINMRNAFPYPYTLDSATSFIDHCAQPSTFAHSGPATPTPPSPTDIEDGLTSALVWTGPLLPTSYAISLSGVCIGSVGLKFNGADDVDARTAELGYWIGEEFWGRGVASAVVGAFVEWTWRTFGVLVRLEAGVFGWNMRSGKLLRRVGFREVGVLKARVWKAGRGTEMVLWELLRPEGGETVAGRV